MMLRGQQLQVKRHHQVVLEIDEVSLSSNEVVALVGPNGAGKSTLLNALSGELKLEQGSIELNGRARAQWSLLEHAKQLAVLRKKAKLISPSLF